MKRIVDEELWVDFLEDELDPALKEDLDTYVTHSPELKNTVAELQRTRTELEKLGRSAKAPNDDKYYDELHDRIMAGVRVTNVQSPTVVRMFSRRSLKWVASAAAVVLLTVSTWNYIGSPEETVQGTDVATGNWLLDNTARNPQVIPNSSVTPETDADLIMDAAADRLENMSEDQREEIIKKLAD